MTRIIQGERVAKDGKIRLGCSATLFDDSRTKVLLTQRSDNGLWCLPGGGVDAGERVAETVVREVKEEVGLDVEVTRLLGVYSDPNFLVQYADGNNAHIIALNFEVKLLHGSPAFSDEVVEFGFFSKEELEGLPFLSNHKERIMDAFNGNGQVVIK